MLNHYIRLSRRRATCSEDWAGDDERAWASSASVRPRPGALAGAGSHRLAASPTVRHRACGAQLATHRRRDPPAPHAQRRQHRLLAGGLDRSVRDGGRRTVSVADHQPGRPPIPARVSAGLVCPASRRRTWRLELLISVGSRPGSANHLEVSPMQPYRIGSARQLRLVHPDAESTEVDDVWDAVPEDSRREVLKRLAELLRRWFDTR